MMYMDPRRVFDMFGMGRMDLDDDLPGLVLSVPAAPGPHGVLK